MCEDECEHECKDECVKMSVRMSVGMSANMSMQIPTVEHRERIYAVLKHLCTPRQRICMRKIKSDHVCEFNKRIKLLKLN